ncbi:MFS transporter [Streptomyces galbus]|uniref:MFS transporter n=1 Tax=Streptomyces galbus TaxID=33898 RepID=A0A4U5X6M3_STRGB|nr:MFS transporter [Streptomyces galbus]TKT10744.1 MFS transporter [Streptomyces galbus]GHD20950.1 multidrug resistance protein [Streptomyces galbus]
MKDLLTMVRGLPPAVRILLLCATARSLSFFAVLAYMPIFLHDPVGMNGAAIGYVLGACLLVGTVASVYGGYLADRFTKVDLMIALDGVLVLVYLALPAVHQPLVVLAVLLVANTASSSMGVTANALLAELVPSEHRAKVFSLRYSLQNIGAAVGPFLGVASVAASSGGPFLLAAAIIVAALLPLIVFRRHFTVPAADGAAEPAASADTPAASDPEKSAESFRAVLKVMRGDRALTWFTLGGIFSIVVYGPLLTFMSQYLVLVEDRDTAYRLVAYISAANAIVVISTQYLVGSRLKDNTLMRWLTWGTGAFVVGLVAMSLSTQAALLVAAVALFTLGEVIVVPAEYMFIDSIAPDGLRGSYFGAQNLVHIGVAVGPVVCGFLLQHFAPAVMFYALVAIVIAGWWFYVIGCRAAAASAVPAPAEAGKAVSGV